MTTTFKETHKVKVIRCNGSYRVAVFDYSFNPTLLGVCKQRRTKYTNDLPFKTKAEAQKLADAYEASASFELRTFEHWTWKRF